MQWLVIPEDAVDKLHLSSLFVAARQDGGTQTQNSPSALKVSVDRRFTDKSILRFQTYIYTASPENAEIDIHAEVSRNGSRVFITPATRVPNNISRKQPGLPYWSEISLVGMAIILYFFFGL